MRVVKVLSVLLVCIFLFSACGGGSSSELFKDKEKFFEAYNAAASENGTPVLSESDLGAYTENGVEGYGFLVNDGILEADMFSYTTGQIMFVGRPDEFDNFYEECKTLVMATTGLSKDEAETFTNDIFFKEDATEREHSAGGGSSAEKTVKKNGVEINASSSNGIYMLNIYA